MNRLALASALLVLGLTTACTGTEAGTAEPTPTSPAQNPTTSSNEAGGLPGYGAPRVTVPLDVAQFLRQPCAVLTEAQISEFLGSGVVAEPNTKAPTGPDCHWQPESDPRARIGVTFPSVSDEGLTALYYNRDQYSLFEELTPADGYPALAYGASDGRDAGECAVRVGTSDRDTVEINMYLGQGAIGQIDPCDAAHEVATAVIGNIKARN